MTSLGVELTGVYPSGPCLRYDLSEKPAFTALKSLIRNLSGSGRLSA
jgi:hypothetical protein